MLRIGRRSFLGTLASLGFPSALLPAHFRKSPQQVPPADVTRAMLEGTSGLAGLNFTEAEYDAMLPGVARNLAAYRALRRIPIDNSVAPPLHFNPVVPGMSIDWTRRPFEASASLDLPRPSDLEEIAFWPLVQVAHLVRTRSVSAVELTTMYLDRLKRNVDFLNCVVTLTEERALRQARQADAEIASGRYRGLLHGIPWGCKDVIAVAGYPTTWGSPLYREQTFDADAAVVRRLDDAGAVLVAKLTTGELALGDRCFGGRTNNPWDVAEGSNGSSAGPAAATAAGLVAFAIGTETRGSIIGPSSRCGASGLKPTFGRVARSGVMAISWTLDKVGPICRSAEDCAVVLNGIHGRDDHDPAAVDVPFNWDVRAPLGDRRVGVVDTADLSEDDRAAYQSVVDVLRQAGCTLVPITMPSYPAAEIVGVIRADDAAAFDELTRSDRDDLLLNQGPADRPNAFRTARSVPAVEYLQAHRVRALLMRDVARVMEGLSAYVTPVVNDDPRFSAIHHLTGQPVLTVPAGFDDQGHPRAVGFVGRVFGEADLLRVAKAYQDATDWHLRHPDWFR